MTPDIRAIWTRMPEEAKERVRRNSGPLFPGSYLTDLWGSVNTYETALAAGERWARKREVERLRQIHDVEKLRAEYEAAAEWVRGLIRRMIDHEESAQDQQDELMCAKAIAGEWGQETQHAVQEVIESGRFGDRRSTLRAARQAAWMVRNGGARQEARAA